MGAIQYPIIIYGPYKRERPRIVTFKISPNELAEVDRAALAMGMSRSELIREALNYYIREVVEKTARQKNPPNTAPYR